MASLYNSFFVLMAFFISGWSKPDEAIIAVTRVKTLVQLNAWGKWKLHRRNGWAAEQGGGWVADDCLVIFSPEGNPSEVTGSYFYPAELSLKVLCKTEWTRPHGCLPKKVTRCSHIFQYKCFIINSWSRSSVHAVTNIRFHQRIMNRRTGLAVLTFFKQCLQC